MVLLNFRKLNEIDKLFSPSNILPKSLNTYENRLRITKILAYFLNILIPSVLIPIFIVYTVSKEMHIYLGVIIVVCILTMYAFICFLILQYSNYNKDKYLVQPHVKVEDHDNGIFEKYKLEYCTECLSFKMNRSYHLKKIGACVFKFDHYCKWLGIVINYSNYKLFLIYTSVHTLNCTIIFVVSLYRLANLNKFYGLSIFYLVITGGFILALVSLLALHLRFIMINETTFEFLNYRWLKKNDKQNSIVYNPILISDITKDLVYIDLKDCNKIFDRNSLYKNIKEAIGPIKLWNFLLPTLNTFDTLNLDVSKEIENKYLKELKDFQ